MEELDEVLGPVHEGVVDFLPREHRPHRDGAVGEALGGRDRSGVDAEIVDREAARRGGRSR